MHVFEMFPPLVYPLIYQRLLDDLIQLRECLFDGILRKLKVSISDYLS